MTFLDQFNNYQFSRNILHYGVTYRNGWIEGQTVIQGSVLVAMVNSSQWQMLHFVLVEGS
jgi:hypothetical protein